MLWLSYCLSLGVFLFAIVTDMVEISNICNKIDFCINRDLSDILNMEQKLLYNNNSNIYKIKIQQLAKIHLAINVCKILNVDLQMKKAVFIFFGINVTKHNLIKLIFLWSLLRFLCVLYLHF